MLWLHHSASVLLCDVSTRTLGAVYDDDVSLTSCLELLQQTGVDIGNVACSKCLQYHSLHRGLEERAHLGEGEGEFSYMSHSQGLSTEEGEPKSAAIFPFTLTPSHPHTLTVAAVIPGNILRMPTFWFISVCTSSFSILSGRWTASQSTGGREGQGRGG